MSVPDYLRTTDSLAMELFDQKEHEAQPYLSEERKVSIRRRMAVISFELSCRVDEPFPQPSADAL